MSPEDKQPLPSIHFPLLAEPASSAATVRDVRQISGVELPQRIPEAVGRYKLLRFIGSGGFGLVFEAIDELLQRRVAIKLARSHISATDNLSKRFLNEARTVAQLQHEGIVSPLDADVVDDQPFIVYPLCPGPNLAEWLTSQSEPIHPRLAAKLMVALAEAVAFSHSKRVLHRDIKPANVLLFPDVDGDPAFPFTPKLTDFGLAKSIQLDASATASSVLLGTPLYLAPEEINGCPDVRASSDVYSLGVVLFELLIGRRPFESDNFFELARLIREAPVPNPKLLRPDLPAELAQLCLTCLHKLPEDRYPTANALAEDLKRFLSGQPIQANPISFRQHLTRFLDHPTRRSELRAMSLGVAVSLVIWSVIGLVLVDSRGEADLRFPDTAVNTIALTLLVAVPLAIAAIGTGRGQRRWMAFGIAITMAATVVSLLSFTDRPLVYPEVYGVNPVARTIVFTLLLIAFIGLMLGYSLLWWRAGYRNKSSADLLS